jgi:hypothetical protein
MNEPRWTTIAELVAAIKRHEIEYRAKWEAQRPRQELERIKQNLRDVRKSAA